MDEQSTGSSEPNQLVAWTTVRKISNVPYNLMFCQRVKVEKLSRGKHSYLYEGCVCVVSQCDVSSVWCMAS